MEIKNEKTNEHGHHIYCEKHTPLKIRRVLDVKQKKQKEEIKRFCKSINRLTTINKKRV